MTGYKKKASEPRVPKVDHKDDPSAALMDMMRQMYEDGDDDMKRNIAKAWTESREKQMNF
jgi:calcyclin binding protein